MADLLSAAWVLPLLPLGASLLGLLVHRKAALCAGISIGANAIASVLAVLTVVAWLGADTPTVISTLDWFTVRGDVVLRVGSMLDAISVMMIAMVSVIALMVSIYSVGYMRDDPSPGRFQALLSLFVAAMLGLVLAPNLGQMFVAWELVGVTSYLLIGFWWHKPGAVSASKKAFVVTRFADAFFLVGLIVLALGAGSLDFAVLLAPASAEALAAQGGVFGCNLLTLGTGLVFVGAWGKSAMFPLHIWLPDAMEGPTPVSSIIHSATMVVAGVFLTARMFPLADAGGSLVLAEVTGAVTALFAAAVACVQRDIKRILAFSTLSQLGYMMFALGVASQAHPDGFTASMFHVFTHAWFKCLLFLGAGVVIHAVHSNDLDHMGGLRRKLPITWLACLAACLAISGIPPFSGFFSKDAILAAAWGAGHKGVFALGLVTGGLTAFYMFRMLILTFHGSYRGDAAQLEHAHEDKWMVAPIALLALLTVAAGWPLQSLFAHHMVPPGVEAGHAGHPAWLPWVAAGAGLAGLVLAWLRYGRTPRMSALAGWRKALFDQLGSNCAWRWLLNRVLIGTIAKVSRQCDEGAIDGSLRGVADGAQALGMTTRWLHNGLIARYLMVMVAAAVVTLVVLGGMP
ncbi:MAG: NADH-quinone oxidoreductase subunit L [Planctomycetota bacterium]|jgi:NADH-quinone oxidoreductase subunit L|nr:NADH-quinone oxidoreductase subunit L [Planctomycetota bacterium]